MKIVEKKPCTFAKAPSKMSNWVLNRFLLHNALASDVKKIEIQFLCMKNTLKRVWERTG